MVTFVRRTGYDDEVPNVKLSAVMFYLHFPLARYVSIVNSTISLSMGSSSVSECFADTT